MEWSVVIKQFVGLFAIIDPIGAIIFFVAMTASQPSQERARTALMAVTAMGGSLMVAVFFGSNLLWFFGISIYSFRVGGGILILLTSIAMLGGYAPSIRRAPQERTDAEDSQGVAIVPLGIPLLAGPGAITTAVINAQNANGTLELAVLAGIVAVISLITYAIFLSADRISAFLGKTGMNVFTRLLGLLLSAISVETIANGLKGLFPALGSP